MTGLSITAPSASGLPPSTSFVVDSGAVRLEVGDAWRMELTLDEHEQDETCDLRPVLPLVIRY